MNYLVDCKACPTHVLKQNPPQRCLCPFVVETKFAQIKPAKKPVPIWQVLGQIILNQVADGSGVVDVDGSGRKAGIEGLACKGLIAGKGQRAAVD